MKRALAFIVLGLFVIVVAIAAAAWLKVTVAKLDVADAREPQAQLRNTSRPSKKPSSPMKAGLPIDHPLDE